MDWKQVINADLSKGFSKSDLELLIGLPKNTLASLLTDKKKISKKSLLKIDKWNSSEKCSPLDVVKPKIETGVITVLKETEEVLRQLPMNLDNRSNLLINAARGRDENGVNNDEIVAKKPYKTVKTTIPSSKINTTTDIPPIPERMEGESSFDYGIRKSEWKRLYNK